jgi:hypothetical protein
MALIVFTLTWPLFIALASEDGSKLFCPSRDQCLSEENFSVAGPMVRIHLPPAWSQQRTVHVKADGTAAQADGQQQLGKAMPVAKEEAGGREGQRITGCGVARFEGSRD